MSGFRFQDPGFLLLLIPLLSLGVWASRRRDASVLYSDVSLLPRFPKRSPSGSNDFCRGSVWVGWRWRWWHRATAVGSGRFHQACRGYCHPHVHRLLGFHGNGRHSSRWWQRGARWKPFAACSTILWKAKASCAAAPMT